MTDRELLELAAKAAGFSFSSDMHVITEDRAGGLILMPARRAWNPLTDDGDAFRLAVLLNMSFDVDSYENSTYAYAGPSPRQYAVEDWGSENKLSASRISIVTAAAMVGVKMP